MANFQQVLEWLQEGKPVKRSCWDSYIVRIESLPNFCSRIYLPYAREDGTEMPAIKEDFDFVMRDMIAEDWELTTPIDGNVQGFLSNVLGMN